MSKQIKIKLAAIIVSIAFLGTIILGFVFMMDANMKMDQSVASECPLAVLSGEICPVGILGIAVHHISAYQSFSSILVSKNIWELVILIIFSSTLWLFGRRLFFNQEPSLAYLAERHIKNKRFSLESEKITRWLSLFESSPLYFAKT